MLFDSLVRANRPASAVILSFCAFVFAGSAGAQVSIEGFQESSIALFPSGQFAVSLSSLPWTFSGSAGAHVSGTTSRSGSDKLGSYQQITFHYSIGSSSRSGTIRAYADRPVVLFGVTYQNAAPNTQPFPVISGYPSGMLHMSFNGQFSLPDFASLSNDSPWVYFDPAGNTFVVSAASDYLVAATTLGTNGEIQAGISSQISSLPGGFTHWTALVYDKGINRAFEAWGSALTALTGKKRPANDADPLLRSISYWTDAGAHYYYATASGMSYPETLQTIQSNFRDAGIRLGSAQLDSWWYPKGPAGGWHSTGGIWTYNAAPDLFFPDLASVQKALGIPLIAHARWIDAASPLRQQYAMSGNVSTDPRFWNDTADYFTANSIQVFEQDWLGDKAHTDFNLTDPFAFFNNMAAAMASHGITMQYCMAEPKHFLQGTNYDNLTTVRTSQDRFGPTRWTDFLYSSRFASALGEFPFTDNFNSTESRDLLFAVLSAGPVGIGDQVHSLSAQDLRRAVRTDGVIVKPDVPATPTDDVFIEDARRQAGSGTPAGNMTASTYSEFGNLRTVYLVAYKRELDAPVSIIPSKYGITGDAYVYDFFGRTALRIPAGGAASLPLTNGFGYWIMAPTGPSGIAFLGDRNHYATMGKKRISGVTDDGQLDVTIELASGETSRVLFGYSPRRVGALAITGRVDLLTYDVASELFTLRVHAGPKGTAHIRLSPAMLSSVAVCTKPCGRVSRVK